MEHQNDTRSVVSVRTMEIVVALMFLAAGAVVMADSWRIGNGWAAEGPEAGFFPFYVGLIMFLSSAVTLGTNLLARGLPNSTFVERGQLILVLKVLVPTIAFVGLIWVVGIYVAAAIFIAFFMGWVGRYGPTKIAPVAILVPIVLFFMFEVWFLVPLPKGPLEEMLGY